MANEIPGGGRGDRRGGTESESPRRYVFGPASVGRRGDVAALRVGGLRRRPRRQGLAPRHLLAAALLERTLRAARPGPRSASPGMKRGKWSVVVRERARDETMRSGALRAEARAGLLQRGAAVGEVRLLAGVVHDEVRAARERGGGVGAHHAALHAGGGGGGGGVRGSDARSGGKQRKVRARRTG